EPFGDLLACGDAAGGGDGGAGGAPAGVVEFAVGRADGPVGGPEELGVEERVPGGERRGGAGAAGDLRGGGGLGEPVGQAVHLAALEGGPPAAFGAPSGEVLHPGGRQGGAVDDGVGEQAGRAAPLEDEVAAVAGEAFLDLGERRGAAGDPFPDGRG